VDSRGVVVPKLTARDFEVLDSGKPVAIDQARFVSGDPRFIAIYLDEYHVSPGASADRARAALGDALASQLVPGDLVAVLKPLDSLLTIRLTGDREEIRRAIEGMEGRRGDLTPQTSYERSQMAGAPERIEADRMQMAISALQALAVRLGGLDDSRKTLLVVTEALEAVPRRRGQEYLATIESVTRAANTANVSVYPIDPRPDAPEPGAGEPLQTLAFETDGRVVTGQTVEDLAGSIGRALADANTYYLLTYETSEPEDGAFHPIEVRARRPGVQVRARRGYWGPSPDARLAAQLLARATRPPEPARVEPARRISPLILPWFGLSQGEDDKVRVKFAWEPAPVVPGGRIEVTAARVELTVLGADDAVLFEGPVLAARPSATLDAAGEPLLAVFETDPGRLRVRMTIQDETRQQVDYDVRDLTVRDLRGTLSIGTPEVLRARNALEFRALDDPGAVPAVARVFSRTERLLIRFPVYVAEGRTASGSARLLNLVGQPMRSIPVTRGGSNLYDVDLPLAGLPNGEYHLEHEVESAGGRTDERVSIRVTS
jgi:VWFA-related protein